jgi:hypothetical protein
MIATGRDIGETEGYQIFIMFAMHRHYRHKYKRNFIHVKDTRLSDIYDGYLGGI